MTCLFLDNSTGVQIGGEACLLSGLKMLIFLKSLQKIKTKNTEKKKSRIKEGSRTFEKLVGEVAHSVASAHTRVHIFSRHRGCTFVRYLAWYWFFLRAANRNCETDGHLVHNTSLNGLLLHIYEFSEFVFSIFTFSLY